MAEPTPKEFKQRVDVSAQRIAKVYAQALLNAADKAGALAAVFEEFDSLLTVFGADPRLEILLSSAAVGRHARRVALEKTFHSRATPVFYQFLQVLNEHERLDLLRPILAAARELDDERNRRLRVIVSSAVPLPGEFRERLQNGVRHFFRLEPVLLEKVDPNILGGLKVQIGDMLYDASIRSRLENIKQTFLARSSHEIQSGRDRFSSDSGN